jgi:hypothetical protein
LKLTRVRLCRRCFRLDHVGNIPKALLLFGSSAANSGEFIAWSISVANRPGERNSPHLAAASAGYGFHPFNPIGRHGTYSARSGIAAQGSPPVPEFTQFQDEDSEGLGNRRK